MDSRIFAAGIRAIVLALNLASTKITCAIVSKDTGVVGERDFREVLKSQGLMNEQMELPNGR